MTQTEQFEELYGPLPKYSEHSPGEIIRYRAERLLNIPLFVLNNGYTPLDAISDSTMEALSDQLA